MPATEVVAAVLSTMTGLTQSDGVTPLFKGVSDGATQSIPESPFVWISSPDFTSPSYAGPDLEQTDWEITLRLLCQWTGDPRAAELTLRPLITPTRQAFRSHIRMGIPSSTAAAVIARVTSGRWGFTIVNGLTFRYLDLILTVVEKITVNYGA